MFVCTQCFNTFLSNFNALLFFHLVTKPNNVHAGYHDQDLIVSWVGCKNVMQYIVEYSTEN